MSAPSAAPHIRRCLDWGIAPALEFVRALLDEFDAVTAERDRARETAARLEEELAAIGGADGRAWNRVTLGNGDQALLIPWGCRKTVFDDDGRLVCNHDDTVYCQRTDHKTEITYYVEPVQAPCVPTPTSDNAPDRFVPTPQLEEWALDHPRPQA